MIPFCILAEPRSGTSFFNRCLNAHAAVHSFGEILVGHSRPEVFHHYWLRQIEKDPSRISLEDVHEIFDSYVTQLFAGRSEKALGFDIKHHQLEWKSDLLHVLARKRFRIIHVVRRNHLRQHVSRLLEQPGARDDAAGGKVRIPDPRTLAATLARLKARAESCNRLIAEYFPHLELAYEELIDPTAHFLTRAVAEQVFGFLEVPPLLEAPAEPLRRVAPDRLRHAVLNYAEVVEALASTEFAALLDDPEWDTQNLDLHRELGLAEDTPETDLGARIQHYLRAHQASPLDPEPCYQLALAYAAAGQMQRARDMFEQVFALNQDEGRRDFYAQAHALLFGGENAPA